MTRPPVVLTAWRLVPTVPRLFLAVPRLVPALPPLLLAVTVAAVAAAPAPASAAPNQPFGAHTFSYAPGSIRPDHVSQGALDQAVLDFYAAWKARYLEQTCGTGRYVVAAHTQKGNLTVSEAHGYGMMIAALMAGADPDARRIFDGLYAYFTEHPTATHDHLMAWYQTRACRDAQGVDSATDGDLDIAFALLLADKQWGSCGPVDYRAAALQVLADIQAGEVDASGSYVLLGDWVLPSNTTYYPSTRTSDFMLDHFRSFAAATGSPVWSQLVDRTYALIDTLQTGFSPATGLLPDFVLDPAGTPSPAGPFFLEDATDGDYAYNAARDPWRIGTDYLVSGDARAKTALQKINTWIQAATGGAIASGYRLDGTPIGLFPSTVFIAPLGVGAMVDAANQTWLDAIWDQVIATPLSAEDYFGNTLKLLALLVMSGNWWAPEQVAGGPCVPETTALCTNGGYLSGVDVVVRGVGKGPGRQAIRTRAKLFFPQGTPVSSLTGGAQLRIEDLGAGGTALFDVSTATTAVPAAADGVCEAGDGWKTTSRAVIYRNRSTALDPPACTPGTAQGLRVLRYRPQSALDLDVVFHTRRGSLPDPVGPVRLTVVLGKDAAAGEAGACAVSDPVPCVRHGATVRCR